MSKHKSTIELYNQSKKKTDKSWKHMSAAIQLILECILLIFHIKWEHFLYSHSCILQKSVNMEIVNQTHKKGFLFIPLRFYKCA